MDDILVFGRSDAEQVRILDAVLKKLSEAGLKLKKQKCRFMQVSVEYLGCVIDKEGIHPMSRKVEAICEVPAPSNVPELRSFLGMTQYYAKFIDGYSTLTNPLNVLLRNASIRKWELEQQVVFVKLKKQLASASLLGHYGSSLLLRLACDASAYGVGAMISHIMPDGSEKSIAYASLRQSATTVK